MDARGGSRARSWEPRDCGSSPVTKQGKGRRLPQIRIAFDAERPQENQGRKPNSYKPQGSARQDPFLGWAHRDGSQEGEIYRLRGVRLPKNGVRNGWNSNASDRLTPGTGRKAGAS
jgi:hypothetical protein